MRTPSIPDPRYFLLVCAMGILTSCGGGNDAGSAVAGEPEDASDAPLVTETVSTKPEKPQVVSHGEKVVLTELIQAGNTTVFDFTSEYCGPCRQIAPYLDKLHESRPDVTVVKIDINRPGQRMIDWQSPVARQFGLTSIPHFKVFDTEGKLVAEGRPAWNMVVGWITEMMRAESGGTGSM